MTLNGWLQILFYSVCVLAVAKPLGLYLVRVYDGTYKWLGVIERPIYRLCGVDPDEDGAAGDGSVKLVLGVPGVPGSEGHEGARGAGGGDGAGLDYSVPGEVI